MGLLIDQSGYSVSTHQVQPIRQRGRHPSTNWIVKRAYKLFTGLLCIHSSSTTNQTVRSALIDQSDRYVCAHRPIRSLCVQSSNNEIVKCAIVDLSDCEARTNQPVNLLSVHSWASQIVERATIDQSGVRCVSIHQSDCERFTYLGSHPPPHDYPHFLHHLQDLKWLLMILNKPLPTVYEASNRNRTPAWTTWRKTKHLYSSIKSKTGKTNTNKYTNIADLSKTKTNKQTKKISNTT